MDNPVIYVKYEHIGRTGEFRFRLESVNGQLPAIQFLKHTGDESLKWGCFAENFWFRCSSGHSEKETVAKAVRKIKQYINKSIRIVSIQYTDSAGQRRYYPSTRPVLD